jgi:hypothetical protein
VEVLFRLIVAYLFSTDDYPDPFGKSVRGAIWSRILTYQNLSATMTLAEGELSTSWFREHEDPREQLLRNLCDGPEDAGFTIGSHELDCWVRRHRIYLQVIQAIPERYAQKLHNELREEVDPMARGYLGCVAIDQDNPVQYQFFLDETELYAAYRDGGLTVYHDGQAVDVEAWKNLEALPFDELDWEHLEPRDNGYLFDEE